MAQTLNATHFRPAPGRALADILSLFGPALRIARAIEAGSKATDADLSALGVKRAAFERIVSAQRGYSYAD